MSSIHLTGNWKPVDKENLCGTVAPRTEFLLRALALVGAGLVVGALGLTIWLPRHTVARTCAGGLSAILLLGFWFRMNGFRKSFQRESAFSSGGILLVTLGLCGLVAGIFYALDLWSPNWDLFQRSAINWMFVKIPTVVGQQMAFQLVVIPLIFYCFRRRKLTAILTAAVFSLLHLPNPLLMLMTLLIGLFWFSLAVNRTRIFSLALSHLVLAVVVANVCDEFVFDMRVGPVCFQKWPTTLKGNQDDRTLTVFPRLLPGKIERITRTNGLIQITGSTFDTQRQKAPFRVHVVFGDYEPGDLTGNSFHPNRIMTTRSVRPDGAFSIQLQLPPGPELVEIRLFAQHRNGWCYRIDDEVRLNIPEVQNVHQTVCLHPREYLGNIGHINVGKKQTTLIGWGFCRSNHALIPAMYWEDQNRLVEIPLDRRPRKDICRFYKNPALHNCGFVARIPTCPSDHLPNLYVRNSRGELERIPTNLVRKKREAAATGSQ